MIFTLAQPLAFLHSFAELTELPFALLLAGAFWAYVRRRWWAVAILAGLLPTNGGAVNLRGAEVQISGRLSARWFGHVTYAYLDNRKPPNILERILWSRHSGSVSLSREFDDGWQLAGSYAASVLVIER